MSLLFQRAPEAVVEVRADLDEALRFHGLTRARMTAEVIRWLESVRLEDPAAYRYFTTDTPEIKRLIVKWDFVFSTGMTTDYPKRRAWTPWMALREFIQNALDVEERVYGYENMSIQIFRDERGVHIVDRGPGITLEAFKLGGSDKGCEERGYFGEGLKVAAAHFAGLGVPVYVFNRQGQVFKMCLSPGTALVVVVMGRAKYPPMGTEVILRAEMAPDLLVSTVFQEWMKLHPETVVISKKIFRSRGCDVPKPNIILKGVNNVDLLWVRDIFVNRISTVTRKPAIFGYNLWWVPLEPNRIMVADQSALASQAAYAFNPNAAKALLDVVVEVSPMFARVKTGFFETDVVDWWYTPDEVKEAVKEWVEARDLGVTKNERAVDWIAYMGVKPLLITEQLSNLFVRAPEAEEKVVEKGIERLKLADATAIPEEALTLRELKNLGATIAVLTRVQAVAFWGVKMPDVVVSKSLADASGTQVGNKLYVTRASLGQLDTAFSTIYHEYCHYYGGKVWGEAADLTEAFQKSLTEVSGIVAEALKLYTVVEAYRRALSGGWKANAFIWKEEHYATKTSLLDNLIEDCVQIAHVHPKFGGWEPLRSAVESGARVCILVRIPPNGTLTPEDFHLSIEDVNHVIPEEFPPSKELYQRAVERIADGMVMAVEKGIIFMYDPWTDSYKVLRLIGI